MEEGQKQLDLARCFCHSDFSFGAFILLYKIKILWVLKSDNCHIFINLCNQTYRPMSYCSICPGSSPTCIRKHLIDDDSILNLHFKEGELIFDEKQQLRGIYCIKTGVCKISKRSANGKEQIIHFLKEGTLLGIRSILNGEATNLKARALTPVEVCFVSKSSFLETLKENQNILNHLLNTFAEYLKATDDRIVVMGAKQNGPKISPFLD